VINRSEFADLMTRKDGGTLTRAIALKEPAKVLEELYLATLGRKPTAKELAQIQPEIEKELKGDKDLAHLWQDLFWALLNSSEFILNH